MQLCGIINFIHELDAASTNDDVDKVLDSSENMAFVNLSNWPPTQAITLTSKSNLLQELGFEEVIEKRQKQILDILQQFNLVSLILKYPDQLRSLLVYESDSACLDVDKMFNVFDFCFEENEKKNVIMDWLKQYVRERSKETPDVGLTGKEKPNLGDILQFLTGLRNIPPLGFRKPISVDFHSDVSKVLPESSACFYFLYLPVEVDSFSLFCTRFDQAVLYSLNYFGQE